MRGEGKWEHTGRSYRSIARYWHVLDPILNGWLVDGIESLREITQDDVKRAIATRKGTPARSIHIVLRNVFRALRQEGRSRSPNARRRTTRSGVEEEAGDAFGMVTPSWTRVR